MYLYQLGAPSVSWTSRFSEVTFSGNTASNKGGGMYVQHDYANKVLLESCNFMANVATYGGALSQYGGSGCSIGVAGCVFSSNSVTF